MNWTLVDIAAAILIGLLLLGLYLYFSRARPGVKPPPPPADDWGGAEPLVPASSADPEPPHGAGHPPDRLSPFDAVARAMDMASLLAGAVAMNNTGQADAYAARLRRHLVKYIYPQEAQAGSEVPKPIRPRLRPMIEELAGTWEVQAELETDAEPGRRETLRECADTLRMLLQVSDGGDEVR